LVLFKKPKPEKFKAQNKCQDKVTAQIVQQSCQSGLFKSALVATLFVQNNH
jgi:hypothetical protein